MRKQGITLIELLVALAILGVLMVAFTSFFVATLRTTSDFDRRNELLLDGQIAYQLLASRLQEAWFVYPSGQSIALSSPAAWQTTHPTGSNVWTVGGEFVAVVLPPLRIGAACSPATPGQTDGCYRFLAYYPLSRAAYVANTTGDIFARLPPDGADADAWVLMQYTAFLAPTAVVSGSTAPTGGALGTMGGAAVALVADYLAPNSSPFRVVEVHAGPPAIRQVGLSLQFSRVVQGRTFTVGGAGTSLSSTIQPRNQGVLAP